MESIILSLFISFLIALLVKLYFKKDDRSKKIIIESKKTNPPKKSFRTPKRPKDGIIKIALLTNELPPIVYGGVSTWVLNFMKMFQNNPKVKVIPFFLVLTEIEFSDKNLFFLNFKSFIIIELLNSLKLIFLIVSSFFFFSKFKVKLRIESFDFL